MNLEAEDPQGGRDSSRGLGIIPLRGVLSQELESPALAHHHILSPAMGFVSPKMLRQITLAQGQVKMKEKPQLSRSGC